MLRRVFYVLVGLLTLLAGEAVALGGTPQAPIELNRASVDELMKLPGVGRTRAEAIVRYRIGKPFRRVADLLRIKGFGRRTFVRLRPLVRVQEVPEHPVPQPGG